MNKKAVWVAFGVCFFLALGYYFIPKPKILENFTFSSAVYDRRGKLLRLTLSKDEKYRLFTPVDKIPETMKQALLLYEDKNFYSHHGVDFFSILRAAKNTFAGGRKEGASTITMQLARLIYNIDSSTVAGKMHQMLRAIQLERHYSKEEILEGYFNLAPYGDNIEGVGSASLIYFGHAADKLTLPEALSLAVIPQNPAKRGPSRGQGALDTARRRLADIWKKTYPKEEQNAYLSLPVRFYTKRDIPFAAPHLTGFVLN
ncbi:MAG: transglycosylase domain-containing protein, partial [Lactobacillales bacterium]|nr:transglycosylase domain-containing protein [Lactobacillales bacterium]